uniref:cysteine-rich venom protein catrin-like n=1 Tax=Euleptes europaea TaxID=460621 RepID=UPI00254033BD|nr:cysteine-rich venom protein catrin-like [Euleptes europaea]
MCGQTVSQSDPASTWDEIVGYWASKKNDFKYGVGRINPRVNIHSYTQAIWYNSYMVGCGVSYCPKNKFPFLYICQYCPAGNIRGQMERPYKKGPPCGDCPKNCDKKLCTNPCKYVDRIETCKKLKSVMGCKAANKDGLCKATCKCRNKIK